MSRMLRCFLFGTVLFLFGISYGCEKENEVQEKPIGECNVEIIVNKNIASVVGIVEAYLAEEKIAILTSSKRGTFICFEDDRQVFIYELDSLETSGFPDCSIVAYEGDFYWTINGDLVVGSDGMPIQVATNNQKPVFQYKGGIWYWRMEGDSEWKKVEAPQESFATINCDKINGFVTFDFPTGCQIVIPTVDWMDQIKTDEPNRSFYKDVFLDAGIGLTTRKQLPAVSYLGLSMEYIGFSASSDSTRQNQIIAGYESDNNGRLLYPDGQPRFRLLFVDGGKASAHGKSLSDKSRERMKNFVFCGGSYVGTCAGAFFASQGYDAYPQYPYYLNVWPGRMQHTGLVSTSTGMFVESNSPLLKYYDFGGDCYVANIRHNKGGYAADIPYGTEILARYDYEEDPNIHRQPSLWAYKCDSHSGRVIQEGSHPEEVTSGERRDLAAAMILYAMDGVGVSQIKGILQKGVPRRMEKSTEEGMPNYTKIGDLQYHHFVVYIPENATNVKFSLNSPFDGNMELLINDENFAYEDNAFKIVANSGSSQELNYPALHKGVWYVAVRNLTTVTSVDAEWGTDYTGRTDVLNGVPYVVDVTWTTPNELKKKNQALQKKLEGLLNDR